MALLVLFPDGSCLQRDTYEALIRGDYPDQLVIQFSYGEDRFDQAFDRGDGICLYSSRVYSVPRHRMDFPHVTNRFIKGTIVLVAQHFNPTSIHLREWYDKHIRVRRNLFEVRRLMMDGDWAISTRVKRFLSD